MNSPLSFSCFCQDIPNFVAFGQNGGWIALYDNDKVYPNGITWASIPTGLHNLLNGRHNSERELPTVKMLAFDNDSSVVCFSNGTYKTYGLENDYKEDLFMPRKSHSPSFLAMNFQRDSYIVDVGNDRYMDFRERNLPLKMDKLIQNNKTDSSYVSWAAMGKEEDSYFISFSDGRSFWNNLPVKLDESLKKAKRQKISIKRVCLSAFDDRYLLLLDNGRREFQYCCSGALETRITKHK